MATQDRTNKSKENGPVKAFHAQTIVIKNIFTFAAETRPVEGQWLKEQLNMFKLRMLLAGTRPVEGQWLKEQLNAFKLRMFLAGTRPVEGQWLKEQLNVFKLRMFLAGTRMPTVSRAEG
jgi:hypothetical protein